MSDAELLKYAVEHGMLDAALLQEVIEMQKRNKYLEMHTYKIWYGKDNEWHTYLPDDEKGRVPRHRKTKKRYKMW